MGLDSGRCDLFIVGQRKDGEGSRETKLHGMQTYFEGSTRPHISIVEVILPSMYM